MFPATKVTSGNLEDSVHVALQAASTSTKRNLTDLKEGSGNKPR